MRSLKVALMALAILGPAAHSEAAPQSETFKTIGIIGLNTTNGFVGVNSLQQFARRGLGASGSAGGGADGGGSP